MAAPSRLPEGSLAFIAGTLARGVAIGIAEVIPGVSGGTIALLTGIYRRLLTAIAALGGSAWPVLVSQGPLAFWRRLDGYFLLLLGLGMFTGALIFANLAVYLLAEYPIHLWSFFAGLILTSGLWIGARTPMGVAGATAALAALVLAAILVLLTPASLVAEPVILFAGGALAVSAFLLPGVSGSFVLVFLGLYLPVLEAFRSGDFAVLGPFAAGVAAGALCFVHLVNWGLNRWRNIMLAALAGLVLGSLPRLWPWQLPDAATPLAGLVTPWRFAAATGDEPALIGALVSAGLGVVAVLLLGERDVAAD